MVEDQESSLYTGLHSGTVRNEAPYRTTDSSTMSTKRLYLLLSGILGSLVAALTVGALVWSKFIVVNEGLKRGSVSKLIGASIVGAAAIAFGATVAQWIAEKTRNQYLQQQQKEIEKMRERLLTELTELERETRKAESQFRNVPSSPKDAELISLLVSTSTASTSNVTASVAHHDQAISELRSQLTDLKLQIGQQKSEIVQVQKIDPALEATLKVGIENLTKRIESIERKQLEKWDVALVCAQVIGGVMLIISAVSGVVFVVVKHLTGK